MVGPGRDAEGGVGDLAGAGCAASHVGPGKERQDGPRLARIVAEIKVVSTRIIKVYGFLHKAKTEHRGVEVQVTLWVAGDSRHVVKADDGFGRHDVQNILRYNKIRYRRKRFKRPHEKRCR